ARPRRSRGPTRSDPTPARRPTHTKTATKEMRDDPPDAPAVAPATTGHPESAGTLAGAPDPDWRAGHQPAVPARRRLDRGSAGGADAFTAVRRPGSHPHHQRPRHPNLD